MIFMDFYGKKNKIAGFFDFWRNVMKKVYFLVLFVFLAFFSAACGGDSDSTTENPDNEANDEAVESNDIDGETQDEEIIEENDEEQVDDVTEEPDEPEQPEEEPLEPAIDPIGNFNLSFSGQINTTISTSSRGGTGVANFNYNGMPFTFGQINIPIVGDIFPLAMVNSGNIIVLWLDSLGLSDISGTSEKQVFGISVPQSAEAGSGTMKDISSYAFYGDITVNIQGGAFNIKCVRAVSDSGNYNITSNDGSSIAFSADGDLFDPSLAGSMIPYPACE